MKNSLKGKMKSTLQKKYGKASMHFTEYVSINSIVSLNALDGIECYHSLHSMDKTRYLLNYCNEHKLYVSGGSDYHGQIKPTVKIGESNRGVQIPYEILKSWLSTLKCKSF